MGLEAESPSSKRKLEPDHPVGSAKPLKRQAQIGRVPNGTSEQPQRKAPVRERFQAAGTSPRCTAVPQEWPNSCAFQGPASVRDTVARGRIGGGRGVRPETFSTFEHTRGGMLQGSRFECRSGKPGRTLWCLGAPTRTCCGVTQGVKLRGQRRQPCQPRGGARPGDDVEG